MRECFTERGYLNKDSSHAHLDIMKDKIIELEHGLMNERYTILEH